MKRNKLAMACLTGVIGMMLAAGCTTAPTTESGKNDLEMKARTAISKSRELDNSMGPVLDGTVGYAVFPNVGKGAAGIGGAYGRGILFERGVPVGYCDLSQGTIGAQLGGQAYSEIVAFRTPAALETFKQGRFTFDAQATAVAVQSGAGANAKFTNGVAVFTFDEAGLMAEASVGGQKFTYQAKPYVGN